MRGASRIRTRATSNGKSVHVDVDEDEPGQELVLTAHALGDPDVAETPALDDELRSRVAGLLGFRTCDVLFAVATHDRPLPAPILERALGTKANIDIGSRLGIWQVTESGLFTDSGWSAWLQRTIPARERRDRHRSLARAFAAVAEREQRGLCMLEAHRHFAHAGDHRDAERFVRYGVSLMVEVARGRSRVGDYEGAAEVYGRVLRGVADQQWPIPRRLRGYARHYLHFNLARAEREDLAMTADGYQAALGDWPDNALFWSRLIRAECYLGRRAQALQTLARAQGSVAEHPHKQTFLVARTVQGLLKRAQQAESDEALIIDAVRIWGDYVPDTAVAAEIDETFRRRVARGWAVRRIETPDRPPLCFTRSVMVRIEAVGHRWLAEFADLELRDRGTTPWAALSGLVERTRAEVTQMVQTFTHELDASGRLRKRMLLGVVDVIASQLDTAPRGDAWVFGELSRVDGELWLRTGGASDRWFRVPPGLEPDPVHEGSVFFAKVETGVSGEPGESVLELERAAVRDIDELWSEWRKRLADS